MQNAITTLNKGFKLQVEQLKLNGSVSEKYEAQLSKLTKEHEIAKQRTNEVAKAYENAKKTTGENSEETRKWSNRLLDAQRSETFLANSIQITTEKLKEAKVAESSASAESEKRKLKLTALAGEQDKVKFSSEKLTKEYELQISQLGNNARESDKLKIEQQYLAKQMTLSADQVKNLEKQLAISKNEYGDTSKEVEKLELELLEAKKTNQDFSNSFTQSAEKIKNSSGKASKGIKEIVTALGLVKVGVVAFNAVKSSLTDATSRFDTLNKYPKMMESLGYSAEESKKSIDELAKGIDGLPTKLDTVTSSTSQMALITGRLDDATQTTIALNNAMLASASSSADAERGMTQYLQMLASGKVDMQSFKTLQETMPVGLNLVAKAMGFVGESARNDLYKALQDGSITFNEFEKELTKLGTGTGEIAKLARVNSKGIGTSFENVRSAIIKGTANIMTAFDKLSKSTTGKTIAENIDKIKIVVNKAFDNIVKAIGNAEKIFNKLKTAIKPLEPIIKPLIPYVTALGTALVLGKLAGTISQLKSFEKMLLVLKSTTFATKTTFLNLGNVFTTTFVNQQKLIESQKNLTVATATLNGSFVGIKVPLINLIGTISQGVIPTIGALGTTFAAVAKGIGNSIYTALGPVGLLVGGVALLTSGIKALWKWLDNEKKKRNEAITALEKTIKARDKEISSIQKQGENTEKLAKIVEDLAQKENKTSADKAMLRKAVENLNNQMGDLNLTYDENTDILSLNADAIMNHIKVANKSDELYKQYEGLAKNKEALEANTESLEKVKTKYEDLNTTRDTSKNSMYNYTVSVNKIREEEEQLQVTHQKLTEEQEKMTKRSIELTNEINEITAEQTANMGDSWERLSETQYESLEKLAETMNGYKIKATDMFNQLSVESEISVKQMKENLEKNAEIIGQWGVNIAELANRGLNEGLLGRLRDAGPESAGHVATLVKMSDEQLLELNTAFENAGNASTKALADAYGIDENSELLTKTKELASGMASTLYEEIKNADFPEMGEYMVKGLAYGIDASKKEAIDAIGRAGADITDQFAKKMAIESPSKVFKKFGNDIIAGLALGISGGDTVTIALTGLTNQIKLSGNNLVSEAKTIAKKIADSYKIMKPMLTNIGTESMNEFKNVLSNGGIKVINVSKDTAIKIANSFTNLKQDLTDKISESMKSIINTIDNNRSSVSKVSGKVKSSVISAFDGLKSDMQNIGTNAILGLNIGLNSQSNTVYNTAKKIADNVANTIKKALDIKSPSRVMVGLGEMTGEGFYLGINKFIPTIKQMSEQLAEAVTPIIEHSTVDKKIDFEKLIHYRVSNNINDVDLNGLVKNLAEKIKITNQDLPPINLNAVFEIDGEPVASVMMPYVNRKLAENSRRTLYFNGG